MSGARTDATSCAETSGNDIDKAASAFSDGAGEIQGQVDKVTSSKVTPEKAGRKFHQVGKSYRELIDKLGGNLKSFADNGNKLSEDFSASAREYSDRDQSGADQFRGIEA